MLEKGKRDGWDIFDPNFSDFYRNPETEPRENFLEEWKNKVKEIIDNYQPDVLWFDGGSFNRGDNIPHTLEVLTYFYNTQNKKGSEVEVINKKTNFHPDFGMRNFEKGGNRPAKTDFQWADDLNIANKAWCYIDGISYRTTNQIIDGFVDRVSRGGALMLSISPKADGTIPKEQKEILLNMGKWLKVNGEGIYGTRKWKIETEGPDEKFIFDSGAKMMWNFEGKCNSGDIRFTKKGNRLFAFVLDLPEDGIVEIKSLGTRTKVATNGISDVKMLGYKGKLNCYRYRNVLTIKMPKKSSICKD